VRPPPGPHDLDLFYGTPSVENVKARRRFQQNRFTVTRQLRYSRDETQRSLDIGLFLNGLPVFTFELKNRITKQTVNDAIWQYRKDRSPREPLFRFGRCVAHFAVDENEIHFCTHLRGKASWFLPFNRGWNDGTGNPPNPDGLRTDYLWRRVLARESVTRILENYAQVLASKDPKTGKRKRVQIWPRYHQLDVVRLLLADAAERGAGPTAVENARRVPRAADPGRPGGTAARAGARRAPAGDRRRRRVMRAAASGRGGWRQSIGLRRLRPYCAAFGAAVALRLAPVFAARLAPRPALRGRGVAA